MCEHIWEFYGRSESDLFLNFYCKKCLELRTMKEDANMNLGQPKK